MLKLKQFLRKKNRKGYSGKTYIEFPLVESDQALAAL